MPRILILGEFSGLAANLRRGFADLGCDVLSVGFGDQHKNISSDLTLTVGWRRPFVALEGLAKYFALRDKFDLVILLNSLVTTDRLHLNRLIVEHALSLARRVAYCSCGTDHNNLNYAGELLKAPYFHSRVIDRRGRSSWHEREENLTYFRRLTSSADLILTFAYEYWLPYALDRRTVRLTFPFQSSVHSPVIRSTTGSPPFVVLAGANKPGFKGYDVFIRAASGLDGVRLEAPRMMPLSQWKTLLELSDLVFDQIHSQSYAYNALNALDAGKLVVSGAAPECLEYLQVDRTPILNASSDVQVLRKLIIEAAGWSTRHCEEYATFAREYLLRVHSPKTIAEKLLVRM